MNVKQTQKSRQRNIQRKSEIDKQTPNTRKQVRDGSEKKVSLREEEDDNIQKNE